MTILAPVRTPVFFINDRGSPECLLDPVKAVNELLFAPHTIVIDDRPSFSSDTIIDTEVGRVRVPRGWTYAGWAEVTVRMVDRADLINNKVRALDGEAQRISAEAQARIMEIRRKINSLLAIEMEPAP